MARARLGLGLEPARLEPAKIARIGTGKDVCRPFVLCLVKGIHTKKYLC